MPGPPDVKPREADLMRESVFWPADPACPAAGREPRPDFMAFSAALRSIAPLRTFLMFLSLSSADSSSLCPDDVSSSAWRRFSAMISLMVRGCPPFILLQPLSEVLPWRTMLPSLEPDEVAGARWEKSPDPTEVEVPPARRFTDDAALPAALLPEGAAGARDDLLRTRECAMFLIFWQSSSAAPFSPLTTSLKFLVM